MKLRKLRRLVVSQELMLQLLRYGVPSIPGQTIRCIKDNIPADSEIVSAEATPSMVVLLLASESFAEVPDGTRHPGHPGPCAAVPSRWTAVKRWFRGVCA